MLVVAETSVATRQTLPHRLLRPSILPDELAHGYAKRVSIANGASSFKLLADEIKSECELSRDITLVETLAAIAGLTVFEFVRNHTATPFQRSFIPLKNFHDHGCSSPQHLRFETMRLKHAHFRVCRECVGEDLEFWGYPYLRVGHHIVGIDWCEKHQTILVDLETLTTRPDDLDPSSWPANPPPAIGEKVEPDEIQQRYCEIVEALRLRARPFHLAAIAKVVSERAKEIGLRVSRKGRRPLLSDRIIGTASPAWATSLAPQIADKSLHPGKFVATVDQVKSPSIACAPEIYCLVLATCFDSAEFAIEALLKTERAANASRAPKKPKAFPKKLPENHDFITQYGLADFSVIELARRLGCSDKTVHEKIIALRLPPPRLIRPYKHQAAVRIFYDDKRASIDAICVELKLSRTTLEELLRYNLLPLLPFLDSHRST